MRLVIDTDAGVDDAQAIMMALAHPGVHVEAITTVTGNVHVDQVTRNVFTLLDLMRRDVPVYQGADQPLVPGYWHPETRVHGSDGLGNLPNRPSTRRQIESEPAALALIRLADQMPGELTLVALGPLTNIALACRLDPAFPARIAQFVFMGGAIAALGNTQNVTAEFNIHCDPEAALIALAAFPEATMLTWEATIKHPFTWDQYHTLARLNSEAGRFFQATTESSVRFLSQFRQLPGYLLPDPLAMAVALEPGLIKDSAHYYVTVELQGVHTRGQTVADYMGQLGHPPNVHVITQVDTEGVYDLFCRMLA